MNIASQSTSGNRNDEKLRALVVRFATRASDLVHQSRNVPQTPRDRLQFLLHTIDETVLPRILTISFDGQAAAELHLSNRRMAAFRLFSDTASMKPEALSAERISREISQLVLASGEMTFETRPWVEDHKTAEPSISVAQLSR